MRFLPFLALLVLGLVNADSGCGEIHVTEDAPGKSPPFEKLPSSSSLELRRYPASKWTSTMSCDGIRGSFRRLFNYITGSNEAERKIDMTTPVLMSYGVAPTNKACSESMSFWAPAKDQADLPKPTDEQVFNEERSWSKVAVRCYTTKGGWLTMAWDWLWGNAKRRERKELAALLREVREAGLVRDGRAHYAASYNKPTDAVQHREVWLPVI